MSNVKVFLEGSDNDKLNYYSIVNDYWSFKEGTLNYLYSIKDLMYRSGFHSVAKVENIVNSYSYIKIDSDNFKCLQCKNNLIIRSRSELSIAMKVGLNCQECLSKYINTEAEKIIFEIENIVKTQLPFLLNIKEVRVSYLEKIYLYLIVLKCQVDKSGKLNKKCWMDMYLIERADQNSIIKSLFKKNILFKSKYSEDALRVISNNKKFFHKNTLTIDSELINKFENYKIYFESEETFLNKNFGYNCFENMVNNFSDEFECYEIDFIDLKEINGFVLEQKIQEAYILIKNIQLYRPIPIEKSIEFEMVCIELVKNYNLLKINSIFSYFSEKVASDLYCNQNKADTNRKYSDDKLFKNKITSRIEYYKKINKKFEWEKGLSQDWSYTSFEYFVSTNILNEGLTLISYSVDEILEKWINSTRIRLCD